MLYRIEDGDAIKILPFVENNALLWGKQYDIVSVGYTPGKNGLVYDSEGYLRKMFKLHREKRCDNEDYKRINITRKTMLHAYINGKSKLIGVGRQIIDLIGENRSTLFDLRCDQHLIISKEMVEVNHQGLVLPSFDNSYVMRKDWNAPVTDINSKEEWIEYLRNNQPETKNYNYSISKHRDKLVELFGADLLSEVIQIERNEKLDEILN